MLRKSIGKYIFGILAVEAVGAVATLLTRTAQKEFNMEAVQPALTPPPAVFGIAWGILYALMGFAVVRVALQPGSNDRSWGMNLFAVQLILNFFWTLIFFNARAYGLAVIWLLVLLGVVIAMAVRFYKVDKIAGLSQIPYILWLCFASYLTFGVWQLNG